MWWKIHINFPRNVPPQLYISVIIFYVDSHCKNNIFLRKLQKHWSDKILRGLVIKYHSSLVLTMELVREKLDFFVEVCVFAKYWWFFLYNKNILYIIQKEKDLKSFRRAFEIFDSDGSGKINVAEMDKLILELTTIDPTEEEVKQVQGN